MRTILSGSLPLKPPFANSADRAASLPRSLTTIEGYC